MDSEGTFQMQNRTLHLELTDDELVSLCQQNDHAAFTELVSRYRASVLNAALSVLRDRQEAEDEVQNALWKAYLHIGQFQRQSKFSTWLTRIVVNQCLMRLRQMRRIRLFYLEDFLATEEGLLVEPRDDRQSPEDELGQLQVAEVLRDEIRRTPPLLRNVFLLRDVEQRPMPEVAAVLGISVAAAKSRLLRARAELRARMRKHYGGMGPAALLA